MNKLLSLAIALAAGLSAQAITLDSKQCVAMALESSADLKVAENSLEQAKLQRGVARTAYLPNFAGSAMLNSLLPDMETMGMTLNMKAMWLAGINVTQPIFAGGKIIASNKLAGIGVKAAEQQRRMTRAEVSADAQNSYWTYVAVLAKVRMMHSYVTQIDSAYNLTKASLEAGMVTRNDLQRIEARRAQVLYQLGQVENGANLSRMNLCHTIGVDTETEITPADEEVEIELPSNLGDYSILDRPEAALLQLDIDAKRQQVNVTRVDYLPTVALMAGWTAYGNIRMSSMQMGPDGNYYPYNSTTNDNIWNIMVSLRVPLWHWGEGIKKVKHAKIEAESAEIIREDRLKLMSLEVRQAIDNVNSGSQLLDAARLAMTQADTNLANITQAYELGLSSLTDLLDAQSQWHSTSSDLIEASTQLRIYCVDYLRVTGRL